MSQEQEQTPSPDELIHYFLAAGEVEYLDSKFNKSPKYQKVSFVYRAANQGLIAADLARIQTTLQMNFLARYSKLHPTEPPQIVYCTLLGTSYLGSFTEKEFMHRAPEETEAAEQVAEALPQ